MDQVTMPIWTTSECRFGPEVAPTARYAPRICRASRRGHRQCGAGEDDAMSRTAHLLEVIGGIVASLGGAALIGYWLFTLGQPAASLNSPPAWTSVAITATGLAAMVAGSLLPKTPRTSTSANIKGGRGGDALVVGGAGEAIGGNAGHGGAAFGPGGDDGSATAINATGRAVGGRGEDVHPRDDSPDGSRPVRGQCGHRHPRPEGGQR